MGNINSVNSKIPSTNSQPFLVGNLTTPISTSSPDCLSTIVSATSSIATAVSLAAACSGTPAAGFGTGANFQGHDSTNTMIDFGSIAAVLNDVTPGAIGTDIRLYTRTTGAAKTEVLRVNGNGLSTNQGTDYLNFSSGTFTPTISTAVAGAGTYSIQLGRYMKIGKLVFISMNISWSAHTGTGTMGIAGLPFASENVANAQSTVTVEGFNLTWGANTIVAGLVDTNATTISLYAIASATAATAFNIDTSAQIFVSGCYIAAS